MDKHDSTLRYRVSCWVGADPTLTVAGRKKFVAMVNIDISDGRFLTVSLRVLSRTSGETGIGRKVRAERTMAATYTQFRSS